MKTCTHNWTVTSECPKCLREEIERLKEELRLAQCPNPPRARRALRDVLWSIGGTHQQEDRIAALEAENVMLREVERVANASVEWITPLSLQRALRDAIARLNALRQGGEVMVDREADARLAAACPATTGTAEDWRRYAHELVAVEKARIIARIRARMVDLWSVDAPGWSALEALADLLESEVVR